MVSPKRALIVLPTAMAGGAEGVAFTFIRSLSKAGWLVKLYVMSRGPQVRALELLQLPGVSADLRCFRSEKLSLLHHLYAIWRLSRALRLDLVYSSHLFVNSLLGFMRKTRLLRCGALVFRESTMTIKRFVGWRGAVARLLYRAGYGSENLIIAQTLEMGNSLRPILRANSRVVVLPNPVDYERIRSMIGCAELAGGLRNNRIVACGRLIPVKGFHKLLEVFASLGSDFVDWQLDIIGDGPLRESLENAARELGVSSRVRFHGHLANPFPVMCNCEVGVISSEIEGFPNVLFEMMASGVRRIVATPCTPGILSYQNVVVAADGSLGELERALRKTLESREDFSRSYEHALMGHRPDSFARAVLEFSGVGT